MTQFVQVTLTTDHARMLHDALRVHAPEEDEQNEFLTLEHFFERVAENPGQFPVRGAMASSIKTRMRKLKGPREVPSGKNKRKARQGARMRTAKQRRKDRRHEVEQFNKARERMEADIAEAMEIAQERARRREVLASRDDLSHEEVQELFELFDLPHVSKYLKDEHDLTPEQRIERAAKDREEYGIGI